MFKYYYHKKQQIALVIRSNYSNEGIKFFTSDNDVQQIGYMNHKEGNVIASHIHKIVERKIQGTPEVLVIKKGKLRLDLYSQEKEYIESTYLYSGDIVLLFFGGHGLKCLTNVEMIEIKQGPYLKNDDKIRFPNITDDKVIINE